MRFAFHMVSEAGLGRPRFRLSGNPLALLVLVAVLFWLAVFCRSVAKFTWDHYGAYEGTVVAIKRDWTDYLTSESCDLEHLVIVTPHGRRIDKYVSLHVRVGTCIRPGDYVIKPRGFAHRVRRRDL